MSELDTELEEGRKAAENIVAHVERMGAGKLTIPAQGSDCSVWVVTVERIGGIKE